MANSFDVSHLLVKNNFRFFFLYKPTTRSTQNLIPTALHRILDSITNRVWDIPANGIVLWFEVFWIFHMNFELCSAFLSDDFNYTELIIVFDMYECRRFHIKTKNEEKQLESVVLWAFVLIFQSFNFIVVSLVSTNKKSKSKLTASTRTEFRKVTFHKCHTY